MATLQTIGPILTIPATIPDKRAPLVTWRSGLWRRNRQLSLDHGGAEALPEFGTSYFAGFLSTADHVLGGCVGHLIMKGTGVWGNNNPVYWGWPIVNFVFWVGIGHAGTLISAILFLFRQNWRTSINRAAEAMTIFAVVCAGMFPGIHIGRVWVVLLVVPDSDRTPGDVAELPQPAVVGRVRGFDLRDSFAAVLVHGHGSRYRDIPRSLEESKSKNSSTGILSLGLDRLGPTLASIRNGLHDPGCTWRPRWFCRFIRSLVLTLPFPSFPGWHTTIFPPYFVAGAIFSGFAAWS